MILLLEILIAFCIAVVTWSFWKIQGLKKYPIAIVFFLLGTVLSTDLSIRIINNFKMQKIHIKTKNGKVDISRTDKTATITEERTCFGFKEKVVTVVTKLDDSCMHHVFSSEKQLTETYKNH